MTNVTYLLGAGASAGVPNSNSNHCLPTNRNAPTLADSFIFLANELNLKMTAVIASTNTTEIKYENHDTCRKLINDFHWLFDQSKLFGTVDTFAKFLHSKKSWGDLIRLKKALSFYFDRLFVPRFMRSADLLFARRYPFKTRLHQTLYFHFGTHRFCCCNSDDPFF